MSIDAFVQLVMWCTFGFILTAIVFVLFVALAYTAADTLRRGRCG